MELARKLAPADTIESVKYFSAKAFWDNSKVKKHEDFVSALQHYGVQDYWGNFADKDKIFHTENARGKKQVRFYNRTFKANKQHGYTREEKKTDVALGVEMYRDASKGLVDKVVLVSNDTDFLPSLEAIKIDFPDILLKVYAPVKPPAILPSSIRQLVSKKHHRYLDILAIKSSQLPNSITTSSGEIIVKPSDWI